LNEDRAFVSHHGQELQGGGVWPGVGGKNCSSGAVTVRQPCCRWVFWQLPTKRYL